MYLLRTILFTIKLYAHTDVFFFFKFSLAVGYRPCFAQKIIAKLLCDDNSNAEKSGRKIS